MTSRALLSGLVLALGVLATATPIRADEQPAEPDSYRELWDDFDLEEKWALYRASVGQDREYRERWRAFLAEAGEHQLLEWSALSEGWLGNGERLAAVNAPQWMRAAIWSLSAMDSHSFEAAAVTALEARPSDALAYAELHPQVLDDPWLKAAVERWKEAGVVAGNVEGLLPPLTPDQVYAHLHAPARLVLLPGGDGASADDTPSATRYVQQVERALRAFGLSNNRPADALRQLERLLGHPHERVRHAACLTYLRLPEYHVAVQSLFYRAGDETESERVREAAIIAVGTVKHPAVFAKLLSLAQDAHHPAWKAVVVRLVDTHDAFLLPFLTASAKASLGTPRGTFLAQELERLGKLVGKATGKQRRERLPAQLERAAWLALSEHPAAAEYLRRLATRVQEDQEALGAEVIRLRGAFEPTAGLLDARWWREPAGFRPSEGAFVAEVQRILGGLEASGR